MWVKGKNLGSNDFYFSVTALAKDGEGDGFGVVAKADFAGDGGQELERVARVAHEGNCDLFETRFKVLNGLADRFGERALGEFVVGRDIGEVGNAIVEHGEVNGVCGAVAPSVEQAAEIARDGVKERCLAIDTKRIMFVLHLRGAVDQTVEERYPEA